MKNISNFKKVILLLFVAVFGTSCSSSDPAPTPVIPVVPTITATALKNPDLSTLVAALVKADLSSTLDKPGTYTVFAPTNKAFTDKYGAGFPADAIYTKEAIAQILLNHVLIVKKNAADLKTEYVSTMATGTAGTKMSLYVDLVTNKDMVTLNGKAKVTAKDIAASNGVIHVVDAVITLPTLVEAAVANPNFKTLVSVLSDPAQKATFDVLKGATATAPLTVLAPVDAAFTVALAGWAKGATQPQLTTVLQYHVAAGNVQSSALMDAQVITTVGTQKLTVVKSATAVKFKDFATDNSTVLLADVQCSNGIIHAIDKVLQPKLN
jgi:uncharacterized surface protein with fasciclin (FAS1) repeats